MPSKKAIERYIARKEVQLARNVAKAKHAKRDKDIAKAQSECARLNNELSDLRSKLD